MIIAIDFDGTCVTHEFPKIGKDIGAVPVLKELVTNGHKLILWTMRSNIETPVSNDADIHLVGGKYLTDAVDWFTANGIELWGIQKNPEQHTWSKSPKAYAQLYIDDAALGCPLVYQNTGNKEDRPYVDWVAVRQWLSREGIVGLKNDIIMEESKYKVSYEFHKVTMRAKRNRLTIQKMSGSCEIEYSGELTATKDLIDFLTGTLANSLSARISNFGISKIEKI